MTFRTALLVGAGLWAGAAFHVALSAQDAPAQTTAAKSVVDGAYSDEQAKRGEATFSAECSSCHGQSLEGADMAPPLAGGAFLSNWTGLTVGDLFDRIRLTMPDGNPGKLNRQQVADVVAYLLKFSKYPAGKAELPKEIELLKQIKIDPPKL